MEKKKEVDKKVKVKKTVKKKEVKRKVKKVYKREKFEAFIEKIKGGTACHWVQIARALGITPKTITEWKRLPEAQRAIRDGIERAMEGMESSGKKDWKMWESKLKMLDVSPIEKSDVTSAGEKINVGVVSYDKVKKDAKPNDPA